MRDAEIIQNQTQKMKESMEDEIESLKLLGTQQRERISTLEQMVAELTAEFKVFFYYNFFMTFIILMLSCL